MKPTRLLVSCLFAVICQSAEGPAAIPLTLKLDINDADHSLATVGEVPVTGQGFARGQRLTVAKPGAKDWTVQLASLNTEPVAKGDVLVLAAWLRNTRREGAVPEVVVFFQKATTPWTRSLYERWTVPAVWTEQRIAFRAKGAFAAREALLGLGCATGAMTIEVGAASLTNHGQIDPTSLGIPVAGVKTVEAR